MPAGGGQKSNKNKKYGRSKEACKLYSSTGRLEKNRKRRMLRHIRNNPNDVQTARRYIEINGKQSLNGLAYTSKGLSLLPKLI